MTEAGMLKGETITDEAIADCRLMLVQRMTNHKLSQEQVARGLGLSSSVVSQFLAGKYLGDNKQVAIRIRAWLDQELKADAAPKRSLYVQTAVAKQIQVALTAAMQSPMEPGAARIALIYGPAGIGKTYVLQAFQRMNPASIYMRVNIGATNAGGFLRLFCVGVGLGTTPLKTAMFQAIVAKLHASNRLIMIDEAHKLDDEGLETVRDLHDQTLCPFALAGTDEIRRRLQDGLRVARRQITDQFTSRVCIRRDLTRVMQQKGRGGRLLFTVEEICQMFQGERLRLARDSARFLAELASTPGQGGLRTVRSILALCKALKMETAITVDEIKGLCAAIFDGRLPMEMAGDNMGAEPAAATA